MTKLSNYSLWIKKRITPKFLANQADTKAVAPQPEAEVDGRCAAGRHKYRSANPNCMRCTYRRNDA